MTSKIFKEFPLFQRLESSFAQFQSVTELFEFSQELFIYLPLSLIDGKLRYGLATSLGSFIFIATYNEQEEVFYTEAVMPTLEEVDFLIYIEKHYSYYVQVYVQNLMKNQQQS